MKVIKRNGVEVNFDKYKIINAIEKAMYETDAGVDSDLSEEIALSIEDDILEMGIIPTVNSIQDMVEEYLMSSERKDVAKRYILYRSEKDKIRDKMWDMTDLQRDIYEKKYRYNEESFSEFLDRVSGGNTYVRKLIRDKRFIPAGRVLASRGLNQKGRKVSYSNCFVNKPPHDSIEGIFDAAKEMARTYSLGGGVGITLENLRPRGARVNNSAKETTGAVSFMDLYSLTTGLIGQAGRRKI